MVTQMQRLYSQATLDFPKKPCVDKRFVEQLQQYDSQSWDTLISLYKPRLRRDIGQSLQKRGGGPDWVEDIEQDTWLIAVRQIGSFQWESEDKLYNWLRSIATYHIKNLVGKRQNADVSIDALNESENCGLNTDFFLYVHGLIEDGPELNVLLRENIVAFDQVLQVLKPRDRDILLRRLLHRESVPQLAKEYNVKPETISVILVRAKHMIRSRIEY